MRVSLKTKFSMSIAGMSLMSLVLAYVISTELVHFYLNRQFVDRLKNEADILKKQELNFENNMAERVEILATDLELVNYIKKRDGNDKKLQEEITERMEKKYFSNNSIKIRLFDKNGDYFEGKEKYELNREVKRVLKQIKNQIVNVENIDGNIVFYCYTGIYDGDELIGGIILKNKKDQKRLAKLEKMFNGDIIITDEGNKILLSTLEGKINKKYIKKNKVEIENKIYQLEKIVLKDNKNEKVGNLILARNNGIIFKNLQEINSYLFLGLLLIFSLIFIVSDIIIDNLTGSLKILVSKVDLIRKGNWDIDLKELKHRNDEIGTLSKNFEKMVGELKNKLRELKNTSEYSEDRKKQLEISNEQLEKNKNEIQEKNAQIKSINGMLRSRIGEITNLYYLIVNVSKYMIQENFYNIVVKGIREGLKIKKIMFLEKELNGFKMKAKMGVKTEIDTIEIKKGLLDLIIKENKYEFTKGFKNPYILPLTSERRESKKLYGIIIIDLEEELNNELKKTFNSYITTILLALENRNLYFKLYAKVNELEDMTKELKMSERIKNTFIANVSHELKVPLVPVKGYLEMILKGHLGNITVLQRKGLLTSLNNTERLQDIMENILNYSRIESGKYRLYNKNYNMIFSLNEALEHLTNAIEKKRIKIVKEITNYNIKILGDRSAITQVFINILSNSIKFSKDDTKIQIKLIEKGEHYEIKIVDNGIGMSEDKIVNIFKEFNQLEGGDTRKYGGVGLGLTVAQKILEYYGATIKIKSRIGEGTEVSFELEKNQKSEKILTLSK